MSATMTGSTMALLFVVLVVVAVLWRKKYAAALRWRLWRGAV